MNLIELGEKIKKIRKKREQTQTSFVSILSIKIAYRTICPIGFTIVICI